MTVPMVPPPPPVEEMRIPKRIVAVLVLGATFGASATVASFVGARHDIRQGNETSEDLRQNQRILDAVCENARTLTEAFTTASPQPCPKVK